jgi:predicted LPLAT superfamily acyltransferase
VRLLAELVGAYRHFYSFGRILIDRVAIAGKGVSRFQFEFEGEEYIRSALREGKGAVLVTAHVGNWEAAAHLLRRLEAPVNIVALQAEERRLQQYFGRVIDNRHLTVIPADGSSEAALAIMAALKRGELVAVQADRFLDTQAADGAEFAVPRGREEMIPFLGEPAQFSTGPFVAAAVAGAPLIHAFAIREGTYRYHLRAFPPERVAFGDRQDRARMLREWMGLFVQRLEGTLREHPLQWLNFYDFWERKDRA